MSQKVYLALKESGMPEKTLKIGIPASWQKSKEASDILKLFCTSYSKEFPDNQIDAGNYHLEDSERQKIYSNETISIFLQDRAEFNIKPGAYIKEIVATVFDSRPRCKNYGCNQHFSEEENSETACSHHTGPPIFHDTMKCWSCCKDRKAFDFESFQEIKGCTVGRHSLVQNLVHIAPSPNATTPALGLSGGGGGGVDSTPTAAAAPPQPVLKSISDYNNENKDAVTATSAALKQLTTRNSTRKADGTAVCLRNGCQRPNKVFTVAENSVTACVFHRGSAIFHDGGKYWSCCPNKKCYDFEDFLKVPGCTTGFHDDGVIEL